MGRGSPLSQARSRPGSPNGVDVTGAHNPRLAGSLLPPDFLPFLREALECPSAPAAVGAGVCTSESGVPGA